MKQRYTPGPWSAEDSEFGDKTARQIVEDSEITGTGAAISIKCVLSGDGMFRTIADVGGIYRDSKRQLDEEEANSRLIAAAPDLLEAVKKVMTSCGPHDGWNGETREFLIACETAFAKATERIEG